MYCVRLSDQRAASPELSGGKGAALSVLTRAGFPVPGGFVVTVDAWKRFAHGGSLDAEVLAAINSEFDRLATPTVAVRSSASVEDGHSASWAGQFSTFLDVTRNDLVSRVYQCMRSGGGESARAYGLRQGIEPSSVSIAVVVQEMIHPDAAGVAFSVDPVYRKADRIVIEAVRGVGSALVNGSITPDSYVMARKSAAIVSTSCGTGAAQGILQSANLKKLFDIVIAIESLFGKPQDIEWALQGGNLWILQSRPITTQ